MIQIQLSVTSKDIEAGCRRNCAACPVALAATRQFPGEMVKVDFERVTIGARVFAVTRRAESWMSRFDEGEPVKPTWFLLDQVAQ